MYPRDSDLFLLLWKNKILTTGAIWLAMFSDVTMKTCYQRLLKLKKSNYIRMVSIGDNGRAWSLSVNGFKIIKDQLPELKLMGYGSDSPIHDLLVLTACYVDHWPTLPEGVSLLEEEEMKRYNLEFLPDWYPLGLLRRPDGIWKIDSAHAGRLVAIEVETTLKSGPHYETIARQYEDADTIDRVIWYTNSEAMAETIYGYLISRVGNSNFKHDFIILSDLVANGSKSKVIRGADKDKTLAEVANFSKGTASVPGRRWCHLDVSVTPHKSTTSRRLMQNENPDLAIHFKSTPFSTFLKFRPFQK